MRDQVSPPVTFCHISTDKRIYQKRANGHACTYLLFDAAHESNVSFKTIYVTVVIIVISIGVLVFIDTKLVYAPLPRHLLRCSLDGDIHWFHTDLKKKNDKVEDVVDLLHQHGDFLLRTALAISTEGRLTKYVVISVLVDPEGKLQKKNVDLSIKDSLVQSIIVEQLEDNKICVKRNARFDNIGQILGHYRYGITIGNRSVPLRNPVKLAKWEYAHKDVTVGNAIGDGAFNEIFKGELKDKTGETVTVAIKTMKVSADATRYEKIDQLMREAILMRGLSHPNIVKLVGVAVCEQPIYILIEYVVGGSLDEYLKKDSGSIEREEKLQISLGAARGLAYIHGEGLIHRDISARNCLYDESKNVKISGFGCLSHQCTFYKIASANKLPLKWMAPETIQSPESIQLFKFSQKTDIYSYGVLIYEIFSCKSPFEGQQNREAAKNILDGNYNTFPASTPKELQNFVSGELWAKSPEERPNMHNVVLWLEKYTGVTHDESNEIVDKPQGNCVSFN